MGNKNRPRDTLLSPKSNEDSGIQKGETMNTVYVEYDGGINRALEEKINTAASYDFGKESDVKCDSGCCMFKPYTRDLLFRYESAQKAKNAEIKLRELDGVRVKITLEN
jgi:hypothetical protein